MFKYSKVSEWDDGDVNIIIDNVYYSPLAYALLLGTPYTPDSSSEAVPFFSNIYIPVKIPTENGMPEEFTYVNIGVTPVEMAHIYSTYYGANYFIEEMDKSDFQQYSQKLAKRIKSVFQMNKGKYLKLMELQGYSYNPLWNVDGTETFTFLENEGLAEEKTSHNIDRSATATSNQTQTTNVNMYDSAPRQAEQVTTNGSGSSSQSGSAATNYDNKVYTHHNADNNGSEYSGGVDEFGNVVVGGDKYHNEKKTRQGNIGVTKTQELIESERENLRFSIIQEFFDDINEKILIGVY